MVFLSFGLLTSFRLSSCINRDAKTGLITNATNNDEPNTMINVIGIYPMNSPIKSSQNKSGKKAARVVSVEEIIGTAISPTPCFAASNLLKPSFL